MQYPYFMKDIDDKLIKLNEEINRRAKLRIHLEHINDVLEQKTNEKKILAKILSEEEKDYVEIQKRNIHYIFSSILGTIDKQVEKEKQEYLHALLMHQGIVEVCDSLQKEKKLLVKSLNGLHEIEKAFERLIAEKERLLKDAENYPDELVFANERIGSFNIQIKEINETIIKGNTAKRYLHKIIVTLKTIEQWGFRGLDLTSHKMERKTNAAQKEYYKANKFLQNYEDQLHDISVNFGVDFHKQIKNLDAFLDRFVDSLITDWVVNNKIVNSIHLVNNIIDKITKINGSLEFQKKKIKKYLEEDEAVKAQIILENINKI